MKKIVLIASILIIVIGVGAFYGGMKYQQSKRPSRADFQARMGLRQGALTDSGAVRGEIINKDETGITIKLADDSSKIVLFGENTEINKAAEGSIDDLETGEQVMVFGQINSDGSITAQNIQLNPEFRERFRGE